jgi:hypothetical protein
LQDRLPKELGLAGITTIEATNRFLREVCLAEHNGRFAVAAEEPASAFVAVPEALWRDVLCLQEERRVGNDNGVRSHGQSRYLLQTKQRPRYSALVACAPRGGAGGLVVRTKRRISAFGVSRTTNPLIPVVFAIRRPRLSDPDH